MNRIAGIVCFDKNKSLTPLFEHAVFNTPHWRPDRETQHSTTHIDFRASERFITPQCSETPVPYVHEGSGSIIIADSYLTNHATLCQQLQCDSHTADIKIILLAYLKWKENCTQYLEGSFCFVIWDEKQARLFAANDHFGSRPLYYYQDQQHFIFANEMSFFKQLKLSLTVNALQFQSFAVDAPSAEETCYVEIKKLPAAYHVFLSDKKLQTRLYWTLNSENKTLSCQNREDYYDAFREVFNHSVKRTLRTTYAITAQISGGLDSSVVACQAAQHLKNKKLYAITAIPKDLEGPSYRKGWYYHEMPRVQTILNRYSNIDHFPYIASLDTSIFTALAALYPLLDQPIRNVFNFDWMSESLAFAQRCNSRIVLTGQHGNGGFSWSGLTLRNYLAQYYHALANKFKNNMFAEFYEYVPKDVFAHPAIKKRLKKRHNAFNKRYLMLSGFYSSPLLSSMHALSLWHGVELMDPTRDLSLIKFCYQVPEWVHYKGNHVLQKRLLVREGLKDIAPLEILNNPFRGEQAADWFLQYNHYREDWFNHLTNLSSAAQEILWQVYAKDKVLPLFDNKFIDLQSRNILSHRYVLTRMLSAGFFLEYLYN